MELMFSDVISLVEEEHEMMSGRKFSKQVISAKIVHFSEAEEAANTDCSNKHSC